MNVESGRVTSFQHLRAEVLAADEVGSGSDRKSRQARGCHQPPGSEKDRGGNSWLGILLQRQTQDWAV